MIRLLRRGNFFGLTGPYSETLKRIAKETPGMQWSPPARAWVGYEDAVAIVVKRCRAEGVSIIGEVDSSDEPMPTSFAVSYDGLRDYQKAGVDFLVSHAQAGCLLADEMSLGKAQPISATVLTPSGWRKIGELKIGDLVVGSSGRPIAVTGIFPQGRQDVYEVTMTSGAKTCCTLEHLWAVQTPNDRFRGGANRVMELRDIVDTGLKYSGLSHAYKFSVPTMRPFDLPERGFEAHPYVIGAIVANGSVKNSLGFHGGEDQIAVFEQYLPDDYCVRSERVVHVAGGAGRPNWLLRTITSMRLCDPTRGPSGKKKSHTKQIPDEYLWGSIEQRIDLLQGLMDNDGTINADGSTVEYNTTSPVLADQVLHLIRSLGGTAWMTTRIPTYTHKGEKLKGRRDHRIRMRLPIEVEPFQLVRKKARTHQGLRRLPQHSIASVHRVGREGCVCIRVDAVDSLYVTDDFVVTHNSRQAIRAARAFKDKTVIVCPSFVRGVWAISSPERKCEIALGWPKAKFALLSTTKPTPIDPMLDVVVIHYDILYAWVDALIAWRAKLAIFDEAQYLLGSKTRRTQAAVKLARSCAYRIGLTGTPMMSRTRDLWSVIETISEGRFGRFFTFALRHCDARREQVTPTKVVWKFDGASNLEELQERLNHGVMLRRTKSEVAIELPPMTRQIVELDVKKGFMISPTSALRSDRILRQSLDLAADGKIPEVIEMACSYVEQGHKIIVFTYRKSIAHTIADGIASRLSVNVKVITGDVPHDKRHKIIAEKPDVLCATMDSCGSGVSLAYADVGLFAELHYVPAVLLQAEARLPRPDSKASRVLIVYACARGTADDLIRRIVLSKLDTFQKAIGKTDDKLLDDLGASSKEEASVRMKRLYERLLKEDAA